MRKTVTATQLARNLRHLLDQVEFRDVELSIVRNNHAIARIVPGPGRQTALEAMGDLFGTLPEDAAKGWIKAARSRRGSIRELRDPWAT